MGVPAELLKDALTLEAPARAELADKLLASLDQPDEALDALWAAEAESRVDAYERGEISTQSIHEVMGRYKAR